MITIPIGGSTGLDHTSSANLDEAEQWLRNNWSEHRGPIVKELVARFGLTSADALQVISNFKKK